MPLYEYRCAACRHEFEVLVRTGTVLSCPECRGIELERLISAFAVDSDGTRAASRARSMPRAVSHQRDREVAEVETYQRHRH